MTGACLHEHWLDPFLEIKVVLAVMSVYMKEAMNSI